MRFADPLAQAEVDRLEAKLARSITISPGMRGGNPTISGTRLPASSVVGAAWGGGIEEPQSRWPYLNRETVLVACWYAGRYGLPGEPKYRKRFGEWAHEFDDAMWAGRFGEVPDPPTAAEL